MAIANLIKWIGIQTSYDKVLEFCLGTRAYHPYRGMFPFQMRYILQTFAVKFKVRKKFTIEDLNALLESGGSCIFVYQTPAGSNHVVFIDRRLQGGYRSWNRKKGWPPFFSDADMAETIVRSAKRNQLYVYAFQGVRK